MSNPIRTSSTYFRNIARKILFTGTRNRLVALFVLTALAGAVAFSTTSSAKRLVSKVAPDWSQKSGTEREALEGALFKDSANPNTGLESQTQGNNAQTRVDIKAKETRLIRAHDFKGDLRSLPYVPPVKRERPELEEPDRIPVPYVPSTASAILGDSNKASAPSVPSAPAPAPLITFEGLDNATWGAGHPPDTNGDVGPNHYIQTINTSIGVYDKSNGTRLAAFTFDTFMSQGNFGNVCDTNNFGDPVVLYDTFEDRWVISDFAFVVQGNGANASPGAFQCIAVSKTGDPVSGGWNFYSIRTDAGLGDYPKFGIWPDGLYMTADMFTYGSSPVFQYPQLFVFNKAQMYAGAPTVQTALFNIPSSEFALLPSNARLQTGTPPAGSPNYVAVVWQFLNSVGVYKAHVDWNSISTSTFTGPTQATDTFWWSQLASANQTAPTPANRNDELYARLMMQNQYTNIGGVESLWASQTAGNTNPTTSVTVTQSSVRYYQVNVTGGTVAANTAQSFTYAPADTIWRYMPSLAVDRAGNMAIGYTTSNATTNPALKYAGRLAGDPVNSITQTEQTLFQGTGAQSGLCGGATCTRWGDYSAMSLDPDGCTFWYTNEYYAVTGLNHQTRIGAFQLPQCTVVGNGGTISGTVTANPGGAPISGATVALGSRTTTTDGSGNYSFTGLPAGTYPGMTASFPGRTSASASSVPVTDGNITTRNFSLSASATSGCLTDTTTANFQTGVPTNADLTTSSGNVILAAPTVVDQQTTNFTTNGFGFSSTSFAGNTFTPPTTGKLTKLDIEIFCSACSGSDPNIIVDVRTTSSGNILMTAPALLATVTIPGTGSPSGGFLTATFPTPPTLTGGVQYGFVIKLASTRTGTQAYLVSDGDGLTGGRRQTCSSSACSNATGQSNDIVFISYMNYGFSASGNLISGAKDANPATGSTPTWGTLSWTNAALPSGTNITFQAAASNDPAGVFNFTGPFSNGASLAQFNGFRYLKYKAILTSTNTANTPTLNDVTVCFSDVSLATSSLAANSASGTFGGTTTLSATLTSGGNPVNGKSISFTLNGNSVGSATTDASGVATLLNASLAGINAGSYPSGVGASFAGDGSYSASSGTNSLTVNKANQTINVGTHAPSSATYNAQFTVAATATSGLAVTYSSSGVCTNVGATFTMTSGTGTCTVRYDQAGNSNYNAATQVTESVTAQKANQTISVGTHAPSTATYNAQFTVAATATSGLAVSYSSSGVCTNTGATYTMTSGTGTCTVKYDQAGDSNYNAASQVTESVTAQKASQTITFGTLADKSYGDADFNVSATASSGLSVSFAAMGQCTVTGSTVHITGAGSCTITASQGGDSNYSAATDVPQSFNIAQATTSSGVSSNHNPSTPGQSVTFTATVTSAAGTPSGIVTFKDGMDTLGTGGLDGAGQATFMTSALSTGDHSITAVYGGDTNFSASTSSVLTQTVSGGPNDPPTANNGAAATDRDSAVAIVLSGSDPNNDPLSFSISDAPQHGVLLGNAPDLVYVPDENDTATSDSFTFTVNDGIATSAPATVSIDLSATPCAKVNVALAANGTTASASSQYSPAYPVSSVIDGTRHGQNWGNGGGWNDATGNTYPDFVQLDFHVNQLVKEVDVYTLQDNYPVAGDPTTETVFTAFGVTAFEVQYFDSGSLSWVAVPNVSVTGNDRALRKVKFPAITTDKLRVVVNNAQAGYSRLTEVEAYSCNAAMVCAGRANVALSSYGSTASASTEYSPSYPVSAIIDGARSGQNWGQGGGWNDATANAYPDAVEVNFNVEQPINEVTVYTLQDNFGSGDEPTETTSAAAYGIKDFSVQYWTGTTWSSVPGGDVTGNDKALRRFTFGTITTTKIRVVVNDAHASYSRIVEVEAYSCNPVVVPGPNTGTNVALGQAVAASSEYGPNFPAASVVDGDRKGVNWGNGGGWNDGTFNNFPDDVEVDFGCGQTINEIDVYTLKDDYNNGVEPTAETTFTAYGITDFDVETWDGSAWVMVPGGDVTGNDRVWRRFTLLTPITTDKIRVVVNNGLGNYSRIVEIEAYSGSPTTCGLTPSKVFPGITTGQHPLTPALPAFGGTLRNASHSRVAEFVTGTDSKSKNTEGGRDTLVLPDLLGLISAGF